MVRLLGKCPPLRESMLKNRRVVYGLFVLEIVQTVTTSHQTYWYMVKNWNNPGALVLFPWSAMTVPTIDGLSTCRTPGSSHELTALSMIQSHSTYKRSTPGVLCTIHC